uniref:Uncharacterized protein n=1 Tax=Arundo donax TaxID=35708 RepID=A0A0A8YB67_ARUDO
MDILIVHPVHATVDKSESLFGLEDWYPIF